MFMCFSFPQPSQTSAATITDASDRHNKDMPERTEKAMQDQHTRRSCLIYGCVSAAACVLPGSARAAEIRSWPARGPVPPLLATDLDGRSWTLAGLRGKAVVLNFWATWCEPCRAEMPALQHLAQAHGNERLAVLALNFKEPAPRAERFARNTGLTLPVLLDPAGDVARAWSVRIFPTTILIAADGRPRWRVRGEFDWTGAEAARMVQSLLA
jgi:thiol-disulfide isomerase/thioredoxin